MKKNTEECRSALQKSQISRFDERQFESLHLSNTNDSKEKSDGLVFHANGHMTFSNQTSGSELLQQIDYKRGKAMRAHANNNIPLNMGIYQQP